MVEFIFLFGWNYSWKSYFSIFVWPVHDVLIHKYLYIQEPPWSSSLLGSPSPWTAHQDHRKERKDCWCLKEAMKSVALLVSVSQFWCLGFKLIVHFVETSATHTCIQFRALRFYIYVVTLEWEAAHFEVCRNLYGLNLFGWDLILL